MNLAALALDNDWLASLGEIAAQSGLALRPARLAAEVRALSDAYNTGAFARSRTRGALSARLMFSFPRDVPKMGAAVRELVATGRLVMPPGRPLRVLDVGAGLGASSWGLARMLALAGQRGTLEVTLLDEDGGALVIAAAIARTRRTEGALALEVKTVRDHASKAVDLGTPLFDVILVGQSLAEISDDEASLVTLLRTLVGVLEQGGALVVVEPALRDRTRHLHRIRDELVATASATVFAPCLHERPCPALRDPDAWCHEDLPIDLPKDTAAIARAAGLRWQGLTFSYLVLRKDGVTLREAIARGAGNRAYRVVSSPIVTKGKRELFVCGQGQRWRLTRLDRDGTKGDDWASAGRGDLLAFEPELEPGTSRISAQTSIEGLLLTPS